MDQSRNSPVGDELGLYGSLSSAMQIWFSNDGPDQSGTSLVGEGLGLYGSLSSAMQVWFSNDLVTERSRLPAFAGAGVESRSAGSDWVGAVCVSYRDYNGGPDRDACVE